MPRGLHRFRRLFEARFPCCGAPAHHVPGDRVVLRTPTKDDADALLASIDDEVMQRNGWTVAHRSDWDHLFHHVDRHPQLWAQLAVELPDGEVVGLITGELHEALLVLGWWLAPGARGMGIGTSMLQQAIAFWSAHVRVDSIRASTEVDNEAARRQIEKAGGVPLLGLTTTLPDGRETEGIEYAWPVAAPLPSP